MVQFGREVKRPCVEALMVLVVVMISFGKFGNLFIVRSFSNESFPDEMLSDVT